MDKKKPTIADYLIEETKMTEQAERERRQRHADVRKLVDEANRKKRGRRRE